MSRLGVLSSSAILLGAAALPTVSAAAICESLEVWRFPTSPQNPLPEEHPSRWIPLVSSPRLRAIGIATTGLETTNSFPLELRDTTQPAQTRQLAA